MWKQELYLKGLEEGYEGPCDDTISWDDYLLDPPRPDDDLPIAPGSMFVYVVAVSAGYLYLLGGFPFEASEPGEWTWGNCRLRSDPAKASIYRSDVVVPVRSLEAISMWRGRGARAAQKPLALRYDDHGCAAGLNVQALRRPALMAWGWDELDALLQWPDESTEA